MFWLPIILRDLASFIDAAVPLTKACQSKIDSKSSQPHVWISLSHSFEANKPVSAAIEQSPLKIEPWMIHWLQAGEQSGTLSVVLNQLADEIETWHQWRRSLAVKLVYPAMIIHAVAVLPMFPIAVNQGLPAAAIWFFSVLSLIYLPLLGFLMLRMLSRRNTQLAIKLEELLRFPIIRPVIRLPKSARFYSTLSILIKSSIRWEIALQQAAHASGSSMLEDRIQAGLISLNEGKEVHQILSDTTYFANEPLMFIHTGELSGTLHQSFEQAAKWCIEQASKALNRLSLLGTIMAYAVAIVLILASALVVLGPIYLEVYRLLDY
ncbi:MAG: type II secretion system F family protein [Verrucomicrobiota bacterium]